MENGRSGWQLAVAVLLLAAGCRPGDPAGRGPLAGLMLPVDGRMKHVASTDPQGRNNDFRSLAPGETITLLQHQGAGIVRRFWMTMRPQAVTELFRKTILRMYWDGESAPSVEVPIGDFF